MKKVLAIICLLCTAAVTSAQVTFTYDSGDNNDTWNMLLSPENVTIDNAVWRANQNKGAYVILKASSATYIQGYTIELGPKNNSNTGMPYSWTLEGSNDKGTWTTIHTQTQANRVKEDEDAGLFASKSKAYTYYCSTNSQYEYYKLTVNGKCGGNWGCFEMAKFDLIPSSVGFSGTGNATDGNTGTKLEGNVTQTIVMESTASSTIKGYQFTTANDTQTNPGRNPKNWTLEGSNDNSSWTTIDTKSGFSVMEGKNYYPYAFILNNVSPYRYYRFTVNGVQSGNYCQLSEVALITEPTNSTDGICEIKTPTDLIAFSGNVNEGKTRYNGVLTANLDMSGISYTPIGTDTYRYKGSFNGQGHSINLNINSTEACQGLFGHATNGARFSNLIITGTVKGNGSCATLIGEGRGDHDYIFIRNVGLEANVTSTDGQNGAFVGNNWGGTIKLDIENSYNSGNISGPSNTCVMGGWSNWKGHRFTNVYNIGEITGSVDKFVWGNDEQATFTNCYTTSTESKDNIPGLTQKISADMITSGELCVALGSAFTQDLSQEGHPTFGSKAVTGDKWFNTSENDVYYNYEGGSYQVYQLNLDETKLIYAVPAHVTAKNISVTRNIPAGKWIGLCLPFNYDIPSGWDVRELTGVSGSGENASMKFSSVTSIVAGKPYIVKPSAIVETITATDKAIVTESTNTTSGGVTMVGNLNQTTIPQNSFYINTSSELKKLTAATATLMGFRAYFTVNGGGGVKALSFDFDDDATGINEELRMKNEESTSIFNLAGQRLSKIQKGINIINGKKVMVK